MCENATLLTYFNTSLSIVAVIANTANINNNINRNNIISCTLKYNTTIVLRYSLLSTARRSVKPICSTTLPAKAAYTFTQASDSVSRLYLYGIVDKPVAGVKI